MKKLLLHFGLVLSVLALVCCAGFAGLFEKGMGTEGKVASAAASLEDLTTYYITYIVDDSNPWQLEFDNTGDGIVDITRTYANADTLMANLDGFRKDTETGTYADCKLSVMTRFNNGYGTSVVHFLPQQLTLSKGNYYLTTAYSDTPALESLKYNLTSAYSFWISGSTYYASLIEIPSSGFNVTSGAHLTIKDCTITAANDFTVDSTSLLVFDNVEANLSGLKWNYQQTNKIFTPTLVTSLIQGGVSFKNGTEVTGVFPSTSWADETPAGFASYKYPTDIQIAGYAELGSSSVVTEECDARFTDVGFDDISGFVNVNTPIALNVTTDSSSATYTFANMSGEIYLNYDFVTQINGVESSNVTVVFDLTRGSSTFVQGSEYLENHYQISLDTTFLDGDVIAKFVNTWRDGVFSVYGGYIGDKTDGGETIATTEVVGKTLIYRANYYVVTLVGYYSFNTKTYYVKNGNDLISVSANQHGFVQNGYYIANWTLPDGSTKVDVEEYTPTSHCKIVSNWEKTIFNLYFQDLLYNSLVLGTYDKTYTIDDIGATKTLPLASDLTNTPNETVAKFVGWSLTEGGDVIESNTITIPSDLTSNIILYAVWIDVYELTFNASLADGWTTQTIYRPAGELIMFPATSPSKDGYSFSGWYDSTDAGKTLLAGSYVVTGDMVLEAYFAKIHTIVFDATGADSILGDIYSYFVAKKYTTTVIDGSALTPTEVVDLAMVVPTKANYNFLYWKVLGDSTNAQFQLNSGITGDIILVPHWEIIVFKITFDHTEGVDENATNWPSQITANSGENFVLPTTDPELLGYIFDGWYNGETKVETLPATQSYTLTAKWTVINYNIIFEQLIKIDGVTDTTTTLVGTYNSTFNATMANKGLALPIDANIQTSYAQYQLAGWSYNGHNYGFNLIVPEGVYEDITLVAVYEAREFSVVIELQPENEDYYIEYENEFGESNFTTTQNVSNWVYDPVNHTITATFTSTEHYITFPSPSDMFISDKSLMVSMWQIGSSTVYPYKQTHALLASQAKQNSNVVKITYTTIKSTTFAGTLSVSKTSAMYGEYFNISLTGTIPSGSVAFVWNYNNGEYTKVHTLYTVSSSNSIEVTWISESDDYLITFCPSGTNTNMYWNFLKGKRRTQYAFSLETSEWVLDLPTTYDSISKVYSGSSQSVSYSEIYSVTDDIQTPIRYTVSTVLDLLCDSQTNAGNYKFQLSTKYGFVWSDGSTTAEFDWSITQAVVTLPNGLLSKITKNFNYVASNNKLLHTDLFDSTYVNTAKTLVAIPSATASACGEIVTTISLTDPTNYIWEEKQVSQLVGPNVTYGGHSEPISITWELVANNLGAPVVYKALYNKNRREFSKTEQTYEISWDESTGIGYVVVDTPFKEDSYNYNHCFCIEDGLGGLSYTESSCPAYMELDGDTWCSVGSKDVEWLEAMYALKMPQGYYWTDEYGNKINANKIVIRYNVTPYQYITSFKYEIVEDYDMRIVNVELYFYLGGEWVWQYNWDLQFCLVNPELGSEYWTSGEDNGRNGNQIYTIYGYQLQPGENVLKVKSSSNEGAEYLIYENCNYDESSFVGKDVYEIVVMGPQVEEPEQEVPEENPQPQPDTNNTTPTQPSTTSDDSDDGNKTIIIVVAAGGVAAVGGSVTTTVLVVRKKKLKRKK